MKIAIIGAGFYGCHLAKKIANLGINVDIYEKNKDILQEAINNNQHRLHLGFHYPRCSYTIEQAKRSFDKFYSQYGFCIDEIKDNFYAIHKDSHINFDQYKEIFNNHGVEFTQVDVKNLSHYFNNSSDILGIIRVGEKKINLLKLITNLKKEIYENKNINLFVNTKINFVFEDSTIKTNFFEKKYDFVINTTYSNPSLGLDQNKFKTKNELCFLVLANINDPKYINTALTVVDGGFGSIYPADYENTFTLSSVKYTPLLHNLSDTDINNMDSNKLDELSKEANNNIVKHIQELFNLSQNNIKIIKSYISFKTKLLNDLNDFRGSYYVRNKNNISFLCGKISAVLDLEESLLKEIKI